MGNTISQVVGPQPQADATTSSRPPTPSSPSSPRRRPISAVTMPIPPRHGRGGADDESRAFLSPSDRAHTGLAGQASPAGSFDSTMSVSPSSATESSSLVPHTGRNPLSPLMRDYPRPEGEVDVEECLARKPLPGSLAHWRATATVREGRARATPGGAPAMSGRDEKGRPAWVGEWEKMANEISRLPVKKS